MTNIKMKNIIKKYWRGLIVLALAICFFIGSAAYISYIQADNFIKWESPDETANYTFTKLYGQTKEMIISEKYNLYVDDIIHPRSFRSDLGTLKPVSFLGIILIYGKIISFTSYKILPFLTPFFASVGIIFFYLLVKKIFGRRNALISAFLLASFPPYIYYAVRSMFHNVLFIVLFIIGLYYLIESANNKYNKNKYLPLIYPALGGFFMGLAVITRTSELLWLAPVLIMLWLFNIKKIGLVKLILFLFFLFLAILPVLRWNQVLYNSSLNGGYPEMNQSIKNIANAGGDLVKSGFAGGQQEPGEILKEIKNNIFHFGFHPRQSLRMFYYYFINMFYWLFFPAVLGLLLFLQAIGRWKKKHFLYLLFWFFLSTILLFYYGSWKFHDNPNTSSFTIGNSYTRYWLPIYLGALPLASLFLIKFTRAIIPRRSLNFKAPLLTKINSAGKYFKMPNKKLFINSFRIILIILVYFVSLQFVIYGSEEGLLYYMEKNNLAKYELENILNLTEKNSAIITSYHDKLFFPERKVIVGLLNDNNMNKRYAILTDYLPVYYYNFTLREEDIDYLNNRKLKEADLKIKKIKQINNSFTLYQLKKNY